MLFFFLFIIGAVFGSFVNVVIDRLPRGENFWSSRSKCEYCHKKLSSADLVPLLSYVYLQGKCRYCHAKIPPRLFVVELISGLMFVFLWLTFSNILLFVVAAAISLTLLAIFMIDLEKGVIPDALVVVLLVFSILWALFNRGSTIECLLSALGAFLFFGLIFAVTRGRGMGFGDVKLAIPLGLLLGFPESILAIYIAFLTGAVTALVLVFLGRKKFHGSTIPFGPFLCFGIFAVLTNGQQITNFVFKLLRL